MVCESLYAGTCLHAYLGGGFDVLFPHVLVSSAAVLYMTYACYGDYFSDMSLSMPAFGTDVDDDKPVTRSATGTPRRAPRRSSSPSRSRSKSPARRTPRRS